ncbi:hypothetical protein Cal7507_5671 [Calothrix sp. PCC 7507]|nr:hypothetical protein Cal7507_5671 [Calothrix sp. PCC 7507]
MVIAANNLALPDHIELPESDGTFVFAERAGGKNFQEHPQSILLTDSILPRLQEIHLKIGNIQVFIVLYVKVHRCYVGR